MSMLHDAQVRLAARTRTCVSGVRPPPGWLVRVRVQRIPPIRQVGWGVGDRMWGYNGE